MKIITIGDHEYVVAQPREQGEAKLCFCLMKDGDTSTTYWLCQLADGTIECDCAHSAFSDIDFCKHFHALAEAGLLEVSFKLKERSIVECEDL